MFRIFKDGKAMSLFIHRSTTNDTFMLIFNVDGRTYYLEFNPISSSMEMSTKTKGELYMAFFNILSFCSVDVIYTFDDPYESENFFRDMAVGEGHHNWPFDQNRGLYKFVQIDKVKFKEFKSDKVLMAEDIVYEDGENNIGYVDKQCMIMHFMILVDEMSSYVTHITNTENKD
jgi:hypothetical protein